MRAGVVEGGEEGRVWMKGRGLRQGLAGKGRGARASRNARLHPHPNARPCPNPPNPLTRAPTLTHALTPLTP